MSQQSIETKRLILRRFNLSDATRVQELAGDKRIAEMTANIPHPYKNGMAEAWIRTHCDLWELKQSLIYAITLKDSGQLIGAISLTEITANDGNLGYWLGVPFWGKGYCTEASLALIEFAFKHLQLPMLYARHLPENSPSGSVILKSGFSYRYDVEVTASGKVRKVRHYELQRKHI
ncbi:GNAT family N-acetyltransferase [Photobacterium profundum]|uniref:GNAT family N-acetyltransferase n=1 Tax=Photobacterium profundum TaxID=74109 RepID=UPI003D134F43